MKKKLIAIMTACVVLVSCIVPSAGAASKKFTDVKDGDWYKSAVESAVEKGIFAGMSDTTFSPHEAMTRAMFAQVLANFTENFTKPQADEIAYFTDVKKDAWYYNAVQWAASNGIVSGKGKGIFDPSGKITRQEMVAMLFNYALKTGQTTNATVNVFMDYDDTNSIADWAKTAISWALSNKIIVGTGNRKIDPKATATRAQVAAVFNNTYGLMPVRKTASFGISTPVDPEKDYLTAMYMTFGELCDGKDIKAYNTIRTPDFVLTGYTGFPNYPEITAYYDYSAKANSNVSFLAVSIEDIFPELIGKTAGEIYHKLGYTSLLTKNDTLYVSYEAQNFCYDIDIGEDLKADKGTTVHIRHRVSSYRMEIAEDNTLSFDYDGQIMFTMTLPESYKNCAILRSQDYRDASGMHRGRHIGFVEPVSTLRQYESYETMFLSVRFGEYDGSSAGTPTDPPLLELQFTLNGKTYQLSVLQLIKFDISDEDASFYHPDVVDSFKTLIADIDKVVDGIKINSEATIIQ